MLIASNLLFLHFRNTVNEKPSIYFYNSGDEQGTRHYYPANPCLQEIAKNLLYATEGKRPWDAYISEGLQHLQVCIFYQHSKFKTFISKQIFHFIMTGTYRERFHTSSSQYGQTVHEHWQWWGDWSATSKSHRKFWCHIIRTKSLAFGSNRVGKGYHPVRNRSYRICTSPWTTCYGHRNELRLG